MRLQSPQPPEIPELWPRIRDRIASCCQRSGGKYAPADVLRSLIAGGMQLWLAVDEPISPEKTTRVPLHARQEVVQQVEHRRESPAGTDVPAPASKLGWSGDFASRNTEAATCERARIKAVAITEIAAYPRITVCKLLACTGDDAARWVELLAPIEAWAKSRGCAAMEPICRPGWERRLKPLGYRKTHVVLEKCL